MTAAMSSNWAYAVPLEDSNGYTQSPRSDRPAVHDTRNTAVRDGPSQVARRRTSDYDIRGDVEPRRRRASSKSTTQATRKRSKNTLKDKPKGDERLDDSAWIHRDKLAQIEIREMQEAGFHVRQLSRSMSDEIVEGGSHSRSVSRSQTIRSDSQEHENLEDLQFDPAVTSFDDFQRKRVSTIHANDEAEAEHEHDNLQSNRVEVDGPNKHATRPSTSRIPMAKTSVVPVPQTVVDRDSPLRRSRSSSGALNNWDETQYSRRARSGSTASQMVLDESTDGAMFTQSESARPSKSPGKRSTSNARKPMIAARNPGSQPNGGPGSAGKKTTRQSSISGKRPSSSSDPSSRPSTSQAHHKPEGDPPWLATMYKPDPRLPPDQQMLPTHAKRMMQEQWAREGKTGTVYDREFRLLNDEVVEIPKTYPNQISSNNEKPFPDFDRSRVDRPSPSPSPTRSASPVKGNDLLAGPRSDAGSIRSGGYRITPVVSKLHSQQTPNLPQPPERIPSLTVVHNGSRHHQTTMPPPRVPHLDDKDEATLKKGFCCVVM